MNVQNIPRSDKVIKRGFVPKLDCYVFADFAQIEYRLLAYYLAASVGDGSMAEVFGRGEDLHAASAAAILGKSQADLGDTDRQVGKTYNFLTIYGGGPGKASRSLGIPIETAREQQAQFHESWPAIKKLHNPPRPNGTYPKGQQPGLIQRRLRERGYITTLWGGHLHPRSPHMALNALVQGCAADLMRASLVRVHKELGGQIELPSGASERSKALGVTSLAEEPARWSEGNKFKSHLVNVVHDEMILDCSVDEVDELVPIIQRCMCDWPTITEHVPVEVDVAISYTSWADKEAYEAPASRPSDDGQPDDLGQPGSLLAA